MKTYLLMLTGMLLICCAACAAPRHLSLPRPETAQIQNTGSTNTLGYQITVLINGKVSYVMTRNRTATGQTQTRQIPKSLVHKFFHDLQTAMPLNQLPIHHGIKSASFGTSLFISYKGERSPDLSFPITTETRALVADVNTITNTLNIRPFAHPAIGPRRLREHYSLSY